MNALDPFVSMGNNWRCNACLPHVRDSCLGGECELLKFVSTGTSRAFGATSTWCCCSYYVRSLTASRQKASPRLQSSLIFITCPTVQPKAAICRGNAAHQVSSFLVPSISKWMCVCVREREREREGWPSKFFGGNGFLPPLLALHLMSQTGGKSSTSLNSIQ